MSGRDDENESTARCSAAFTDDRMEELRAEILRLEERSEALRNDCARHETSFQRALLRGVNPKAPTEPIKSLKHPVAGERDDQILASTSSSETDVDEHFSPVSADQKSPVKKKIATKTQKVAGSRKKNKKSER